MLYIIFQHQMSLEDAGKLLNKRIAYIPDNDFTFKSMYVDLNDDEFFKQTVSELGICDFPCRNVIRDIRTDTTYPFSEVATSFKVLWLLKNFGDEF